ncbi:hypothetical protein CYMTET_25647 [Cymbomonas tetramitiformis]|uniref:Uncharacterized protein n=1 Tax=Cymbomonas tetramitiformis TaxID=36881 RepID=A0AAE0FTP2_9CHLO|nr:hypothetical protein CYMTET_25647 [Cymbomonas tetramitiformis]
MNGRLDSAPEAGQVEGYTLSGQPERIRSHIAGNKKCHVTPCPGPIQAENESESTFQTRLSQFEVARTRCSEKQTQKQERKEKNVELNLLASGTDPRIHTKRQRQASFGETAIYSSTRQDEADIALARAFYSAGISHNVLNNKHVKEALQKVALVGPVYKPLTHNRVNGDLPAPNDMIVNEKVRVKKRIEQRRAVASQCGGTFVSDGATSMNKSPIINGLFVMPGCVEFLEARDFSGKKMNNLVYIHWNLNQLDKVEEVEFNGPKVIAWTEGQESSEGWVDAWQDANREANEQAFTANAQSRQTRAVNRAERVSAVVAARLAPTVGPEDEDVHSADEDNGGEQGEASEARAAPVATTRFGRTIRRPASLNTFYD